MDQKLYPLRMFVYASLRTNRHNHGEFLRTGAFELGMGARVRKLKLYNIYSDNVAAVYTGDDKDELSGELYAISPTALKFADGLANKTSMDRAQFLVEYWPKGGMGVSLTREAAWIYVYSVSLPQNARPLKSLFDLHNGGEKVNGT